MKKSVFILGALMTFIIYGSCNLIKIKPNLNKVERQVVKKDVEVKKEVLQYNTNINKGITENSNKNYSEEITVKATPEPIELTANFRIDTTSSLKGDTALKLVDINDKSVSVSIYQNKRTNELTAKITSKGGSKDVPFSELKIKRNYSENSSKIDTTKISVDSNRTTLDSSQISKEVSYPTEDKQSWHSYILPILLAVLLAYVLYKLFKQK